MASVKAALKDPNLKNLKEALSFALDDGTIIETLYNAANTPRAAFLVSDPSGKSTIQLSVEVEGEKYVPLRRVGVHVESGVLALPSAVEPYGAASDLLTSVKSFIHKYVDLDEFEENLIAHYLLSTWVWDAFSATGFLRLKGEPGTGKTRTLQVLHQIAYRGMNLGARCTESALFRMIAELRGTAFIDEADQEGGMHSTWTKLLNDSYLKDATTSLSTRTEADHEVKTFKIGGPKVLGNREAFRDRALETRCLTVQLINRKMRADVPRQLPKEQMVREAAVLRAKLLQYRLDTLKKITVDESDLLHLEGRQAQIGLPIYTISPDPEFKVAFLRFLERESAEARANNPTVLILGVAHEYCEHDQRLTAILVKDIADRAFLVAQQRSVSSAAEFQPRRAAEHLRSLGFTIGRSNRGNVLHIDRSLLAELVERHAIDSDDGLEAMIGEDDDVTVVTNSEQEDTQAA